MRLLASGKDETRFCSVLTGTKTETMTWWAPAKPQSIGSCAGWTKSCRLARSNSTKETHISLQLINEKKLKKHKKYVDSGQIHFHRVHLWQDYTFLDFIRGGFRAHILERFIQYLLYSTELDFTVAVDFTKSNLPMQDASSLHRRDRMNQYELAIGAIAEICQHYSRSKANMALLSI